MARKRAARKSNPKKYPGKGVCAFWGFVVIILGVLFLLEDLGQITLYGISWWSTAFILIGLMKLTKGLY